MLNLPFFKSRCKDLTFAVLCSMIRAGGKDRELAIKCLISRFHTIRYGKETLSKFHSLNNDDFDDAFADALVDLETQILSGKTDDPEKIPGMVKTFFYRNLIDLLRKQTNSKGRVIKLSVEEAEMVRMAGVTDMEDIFKEPDPCLVIAFAKLGEKCRELLTRFYYFDLTLDEIALQYYKNNKKVAAVSLFNCREKLIQIITELCQKGTPACRHLCHKYNLKSN